MTTSQTKHLQSNVQYELLYHPGIPGRGEYIRLAFEATGTTFSDVVNKDKTAHKLVMAQCQGIGEDANPPAFAPPMLKVTGGGKHGKDLLIYQTPNILLYLGSKLGLSGSDEQDLYFVNQLALTVLDFTNEAHDTHHPLAVMKYYEDQKDAAKEKATDFRQSRMPKFLSHFERTLKGNEDGGSGKCLVGTKLTYADTTFWQTLDGLMFAFPKEVEAIKKDYPLVFDTFYPSLKAEPWLKSYLESGRRLDFSMGVFRKYPELDRQ